MIDWNQELTQIKQEIKQKEADITAIKKQLRRNPDDIDLSVDLEEKQLQLKDLNHRYDKIVDASAAHETKRPRLDLQTPCKVPFFNKLGEAVEQEEYLVFQEQIPSSRLDRIYIRDCYPSIASSLKRAPQKVLITGTPGIGKSLFLYYLLWQLVKKNQRVLLIYSPFLIYYDGKGGVFELLNPPPLIDHDFWSRNLWCLFDGKYKKESDLSHFDIDAGMFVLSTPPRRELINDFKKPPVAQYFYMPVWTESELERIATLFNVADWKERYSILGGIPRYVLEDTSNEARTLLYKACQKCSLNECIRSVGIDSDITDKSKVVHSLIHMTSEPPYSDSSVAYASPVAIDFIVQRHGSEARMMMKALLQSVGGEPLGAAFCGYIFEPYAIGMLEKGGRFKCRRLVHGNTRDKPEETEIEIPSSQKIVAEDIMPNQAPRQLYVPKTKNFVGIDAWMHRVGGFQITGGRSHEINRGTEDHLKELGENGNKLYWLLPPIYYRKFTKKTPQTIDQYAVLIPYPTPIDD